MNDMKVDVINTAKEVTEKKIRNKTVVVIDVLRATSVMVTAIHNGAFQIIPVLSPEEAFKTRKQIDGDVILGGERHAEPIEGFDFGNSPLSYTVQAVQHKTLVMTTSNGTLAIRNSLEAQNLLIGSFLNAKAIAKKIGSSKDIVFVCSGTNGAYTLEDNLCAGYIISLLKTTSEECHLSDSALASYYLYHGTKKDVSVVASQGLHYNILKSKNYLDDLHECFTLNKYNVVPEWNGKSIV